MLDRMLTLLLLVVAMSFTLASASLADDWVAVKLRGQVLQLVGGDWAKLQRGDVVLGVHNSPIASVAELQAAVKAAKDAGRDAVLLQVKPLRRPQDFIPVRLR